MGFLLFLGVIFVLVALYLLFRVSNLITLVKPKEAPEGTKTNHGFYFFLFMVVSLILFFWYSFKHFKDYDLPVASVHGIETDRMFWLTMAITVFAFVVVFITMFWFTYKYSYKEGRRATFFADNSKLEIIWTVIPAFVLVALIWGGLKEWSNITSPASKDAEVIELVGQQFAWTARYPGVKDKQLGKYDFRLIDPANEFGLDLTDPNSFDDFKSLELHLPKGKEVLLKIRAKDVLHSVFLPHFRVKMDAVPGMVTVFKFTPNKTTEDMRTELNNPKFNFEMACTEICGQGHFSMRFPVVVEEPAAYEKWKQSQSSWLKQNPEYFKRIPDKLKAQAMLQLDSAALASIPSPSSSKN